MLGAAGVPAQEPLAGENSAHLRDLLACLARTLRANDPAEFVEADHRTLLSRLQASGIEIPNAVSPLASPPAFLAQFDAGFEGMVGAGILRGVRARGDDEISLTGLLGGVPMDSVAAWMLATSVMTSAKARPERPIVLVLDSGPAPSAMDESAPLSEYLAHLARAVAWARLQAVAVNIWVVGGVDAASLVACTAAAARVIAFPEAVLHAESASARSGTLPSPTSASKQWVAAGMVDELADASGRVAIVWNVSA